MVIVVWTSYVNDINPIILDEKQKGGKFLGSGDAETQMPSVALSSFMNILNALLQVKPKTLRIKRRGVDLFYVRSGPSRPFS